MSFLKSLRLFVLLFGVFVFTMDVNAQTTPPPYVPNVFPPSPNAASLMKFTDVPVSPYTGTSSVTVPFYSIQAKGVTVPVSIDYHTGGIRVAEDAGVVGLGWALNAGGMISRTVRDKDDLTSDYFTQILPVMPGDLSSYQPANSLTDTSTSGPVFNTTKYLFVFNCSYLVNMASGAVADYTSVLSGATNGVSNSDIEPDSYSYNFLGMSGKFIIRPDRTIVMEKQDNIRIQFTSANNFLITDDQGNKYYFNDIEYAGTLSDYTSTQSSWHLTKIVTQQNDVITFHYVQTGVIKTHQGNAQTYQGFCYGTGYTEMPDITSVYANYKLSSIDFANGQVQFVYNDTREDTDGGSKLSAAKVYSKSSAGLKLIKEHDLYYSYFNGNVAAASKVEFERLRLDSVKEVSGSLSIKPYRFSYNTNLGDLAGKHSYSIDHWGYFNGAGNTTLIPSQEITAPNAGDGTAKYLSFSGANRESAEGYSQIFSLQKVTYPTGGSSVFEYSANYYDYYKSLRGPVEYPQMEIVTLDTMINISSYGSNSGSFTFKNFISNTYATVNVAFISKYSTGWPTADKNGYGRLSYTFISNVTDLSNTSLSCGGPACSTSFQVPLGSQASVTFPWSSYVDSSIPTADFSLIHVYITYKAYKVRAHQASGINQEIAGGLRVASITDYNDAGTIAKKRTWDYGYTSGGSLYTYGKLMSMPSYVRQENKFTEPTQTYSCVALMLLGSSNTAITSVIQGNIVGYSKVTERTVDPVTNADIGKTVYSFFNTPDSTNIYNGYRMPGTLNMGYHLNGSLLSKQVYRNTGGTYFKVNETLNYYRTANRIDYYGLKYEKPFPNSTYGVCGQQQQQGVNVQLYGFFYPLLKSERILQDSTRDVTYDQNDTLRYVSTVNKSYYDNPAHYQLTRSSTIDDKGNLHVSKITYPQDYITSGTTTGNTVLDTLIRRNMVATTLEKRDSLYYKGSSSGYVTGASLTRYRQLSSGTVVSDKVYKLDLIKPVTDFVGMSVSGNTVNQDSRYRQLINFDAYDDKNNIAQYTVTGQLPVSIVWDYRKMLPIAQIKNADSLAVAYTSFEEEGTGHWIIASTQRDSVTAAMTGIKSYNLSNGSVTKSGLSAATTYIVSYWTRNASSLTITGTISGYPVKGTTINGWTYYEHQVTGQTTITVLGSGNIDEIRLYPKGAQMATYTYTPLVGITTSVDAKNNPNYYEYDSLQRLMNIKDQFGNIIKHLDYHYSGQ